MTTDEILTALASRGMRLAVAESLTGGLLTDAFVQVAGASRVVTGGVIAYDTRIKAAVLGVPTGLLAERGAVDPDVAVAMAVGVRIALSIDGVGADVGLATTGVAGPDPQDGRAPGTVHVAAVVGTGEPVVASARFDGDRQAVRRAAVALAVQLLGSVLE